MKELVFAVIAAVCFLFAVVFGVAAVLCVFGLLMQGFLGIIEWIKKKKGEKKKMR